MAVVHGSWLIKPQGSYFFVWGETWRSRSVSDSESVDGVSVHPLAMTAKELTDFLDKHSLAITKFIAPDVKNIAGKWQQIAIALPTQPAQKNEPARPVLSFQMPTESTALESLELKLWQVEGLCLEPLEAGKLLQALPLGSLAGAESYIGSDLRFWSQIYRWSLELLARCKFLPTLDKHNGGATARWQPLLDSTTDQVRLEKLARLLPAACRTYIGNKELLIENLDSTFPTPQELLLDFLSSTIDAHVRTWAGSHSLSSLKEPLIRSWLQTLLANSTNVVEADSVPRSRLEALLQTWISPLKNYLVAPGAKNFGLNLFRTCFKLQPPQSAGDNWALEYYLQAADDPELLVDAATIWRQASERLVFKGRTINHPQENFLKGLGLAARIYPAIEPSLHNARPAACILTPVQAYEFIRAAIWRLQDSGLGVVLPPSLSPEKAANNRLGLKISADVDGKKARLGLQSLLKFNFELSIGGQTISEGEFKRLLAQKTPIVEINGEWVALQPADVRAAEAVLAKPKDQLSLSIEDALRLATGDTKAIEKLPVVNFEASGVLQELINNLTNNQAIAPISIPASFKGELRPYQERGVAWLAFLERWGLGACLADDMGLGKTPQTLAFLLYLKEQDALQKQTLIICPTSVLGNWEREVKKFAPTLKSFVYHGDKRPKGKEFAKAIKDKDIVITSYPLAFRDAKTLETIAWQGLILDEAQNIKNPEAKQSQVVRQLKADFHIALTGTPVENRLQELWSILDFLNPGYLGNRQFFQRRFAIPVEKYGDTDSLKTLRSLVQPFILRRLKTDRDIIQDLPEKQEMNIFCGLSPEQAVLYQRVVDESLPSIDEAEGIERHGKILTLLLRLKQICNHPALYLKENKLFSQRSGKLQRLEEMLEEVLEEGDRALIFTQFAEWGKLLQPYLEKQLGLETLFLYGSTRKQQREEMIDRFQNDPQGPRIFILSLKAGGTGLNLTRANHVFHYDRWWNPAVENQATDRVFRIGQTRNVQVHKFVCSGTLEERINELIESKKSLAEQTVDAGEQWLTDLDSNQLRNLLLLDRSAVIDEEN